MRDDLGGDRSVVLVSFNNASGPLGRGDAALRLVLAGVLFVLTNVHFEFRGDHYQLLANVPHRFG